MAIARLSWVKALSGFARKAPRPPKEARIVARDFARAKSWGQAPYSTGKKVRWSTGFAPRAPHRAAADYLRQIRDPNIGGYSKKPPYIPLSTPRGVQEIHPKVVRKTVNRLADYLDEVMYGPFGGKYKITKSGRKKYIP